MMNKNRPYKSVTYGINVMRIVLFCFGLLLIACMEDQSKETSVELEAGELKDSTITRQLETDSPNSQFMLEEDGIKLILPDGYERYSAVEYQNYLESKYKSQLLQYYITRLRQLRNMDGSLYIYFDKTTNSVVTVNSTPPKIITKDNAQELLSMIRSDHRKIAEASKRSYEKVSVAFSDKSKVKIFKSIYKVSGPDLEQPHYAHSYIITTENKTLYINADTSSEIDFDPYIEKIQF